MLQLPGFRRGLTPEEARGISIDFLKKVVEGRRWGNALVAMPPLVSITPVEDPLLSLHIVPELCDHRFHELAWMVEGRPTLEEYDVIAFESELNLNLCTDLRRDSGIAVLLKQL